MSEAGPARSPKRSQGEPFAAEGTWQGRRGSRLTRIAPATRMVDEAAIVGYPDWVTIEYAFLTRDTEFIIEVPQNLGFHGEQLQAGGLGV